MPAAQVNHYIAYLIRLWSETPGVWRGMLIDPNSGERQYFANLEELQAFLRAEVLRADWGAENGAN